MWTNRTLHIFKNALTVVLDTLFIFYTIQTHMVSSCSLKLYAQCLYLKPSANIPTSHLWFKSTEPAHFYRDGERTHLMVIGITQKMQDIMGNKRGLPQEPPRAVSHRTITSNSLYTNESSVLAQLRSDVRCAGP